MTLTGSNNDVQTFQILSLHTLTVTGSYSTLTLTSLTHSPINMTLTGSYDLVHFNNALINNLKVTGSYDSLYAHNTTIVHQTITGTGDHIYYV